jgi:glycerol uptake facilitator-like aquaporin
VLPGLARRAFAEGLGTAGLVLAVVGSGIAAERLSPGDAGLRLLENSLATALALVALLLALGPVSGGHLNPLVTLVEWARRRLRARDALAYVVVQVAGGAAGAVLANAMFGRAAIEVSAHARAGPGLWLGEVVATFGLLVVVHGVAASNAKALPGAVAAYVGAAYWFTSSTAFANPAVTVARTLSDSFAGIAPASVPGFLLAQVLGAALAFAALAWLLSGWFRPLPAERQGQRITADTSSTPFPRRPS